MHDRIVMANDRILVSEKSINFVTNSGIILPNNFAMTNNVGLVIGVGNKCNVIKKDSTIMYSKVCGTKITIDGSQFIIMREEDAFLMIENEKLNNHSNEVKP